VKIIIDREKCRGHSNCEAIAPNVFELDDNFKAFVVDPAGDNEELILKAAKACPKLAIALEHETSGERIFPRSEDKPRDQLEQS
jgi:ferredoxin